MRLSRVRAEAGAVMEAGAEVPRVGAARAREVAGWKEDDWRAARG